MKGKLKLFSLLVFGCMFMLPFAVNAASEPVYDEAKNTFYANGTPIVITEDTDGTIITWNDGLKSQVVTAETTVFGGGVAGTDFASSSITMNGGTVCNIFGGGDGADVASAIVGEATIVINEGTVAPCKNASGKYTGGNVIGGGRLASETNVVNIDIKAGTIFAVMGGGMSSASYNGKHIDVGTKANPEKSKNITGVATLNISGGTINSTVNGYGLFYGGGQGYSYTEETTINVSGNADLSKAWLIGGGSNGRTDNATINVNGGTINVIQTINRGSMINANVNVKAGTVTKLYVGGEDPETFDNDIVNGGFIGNVVVDVTGGTVKELLPGSDYDKSIQPNADNVMVFYKEANVTNNATLATSLGTSAKPYVTEDGYDIVYEEVEGDVELDENLFGALSETGNVYTLVINKGDVAYSWVFDGTSVVDATIKVNTEITFTQESPEDIREKLDEHVSDLEDVTYLNFAHHGALPTNAAIVYYVGDTYEDGTKLYVRHYNEENDKLEDPIEVVVENGIITFEISSCSSYVLSTTATVSGGEITPPATGDNILYIVGFLVVSIIGISLASKKLVKTK